MHKLVAPLAVIALLAANTAYACEDGENCTFRASQGIQQTGGSKKLKSARKRTATPKGASSSAEQDRPRAKPQRAAEAVCKRYLPAIGRVITVPCE
jgi:hypothetical protein